jgi:hypothetical protein
MERNSMELIGEFKQIAFEGERITVYIFEDYRFGEYPVGVHAMSEFEIICNVPIKASVRVKGKQKVKADGFIEHFIHCNLNKLEQITHRREV